MKKLITTVLKINNNFFLPLLKFLVLLRTYFIDACMKQKTLY